MLRRTYTGKRKLALLCRLTCGLGLAAASSGTSVASAATPVTIKIQLPPGTTLGSPKNAVLVRLTKQFERAHPNVTVDWLPEVASSVVTSNAELVTEASGGDAPDVPWEQYAPALSGEIPAGIFQNLKPYLDKPNPYVPGNTRWLSLWQPSNLPYMEASNGTVPIIEASDVESDITYNKAAFAKAGIKAAPATWAQWVNDMAALKRVGITPLMIATGGVCDPSWYERVVGTSLLQPVVGKVDVNHATVTSALDDAVGIERGVISMSDPRYAEVWKLIEQLQPYLATGANSYDACSAPNATSPPLSPQSLLIKGKVAMLWLGAWTIPNFDQAGFSGKFGVFPEPTITQATTRYATGVVTKGIVGGPNGVGSWSVTTQKADNTMTPAKTAMVMNFLAYLFTPKNESAWVAPEGCACIPTDKGATVPNVPGLLSLEPGNKIPVQVDVLLDDVLGSQATNEGDRLFASYVDGDMSYSSFAGQWQSLLQSAASTWAQQNHINLKKYK